MAYRRVVCAGINHVAIHRFWTIDTQCQIGYSCRIGGGLCPAIPVAWRKMAELLLSDHCKGSILRVTGKSRGNLYIRWHTHHCPVEVHTLNYCFLKCQGCCTRHAGIHVAHPTVLRYWRVIDGMVKFSDRLTIVDIDCQLRSYGRRTEKHRRQHTTNSRQHTIFH